MFMDCFNAGDWLGFTINIPDFITYIVHCNCNLQLVNVSFSSCSFIYNGSDLVLLVVFVIIRRTLFCVVISVWRVFELAFPQLVNHIL